MRSLSICLIALLPLALGFSLNAPVRLAATPCAHRHWRLTRAVDFACACALHGCSCRLHEPSLPGAPPAPCPVDVQPKGGPSPDAVLVLLHRRHAPLPIMNEAEKPKEAADAAAAPAPVAPDLGVPAVPKDEGFDITKCVPKPPAHCPPAVCSRALCKLLQRVPEVRVLERTLGAVPVNARLTGTA